MPFHLCPGRRGSGARGLGASTRAEGAALARPPCPRVPPLAAAAPALAPYLELRHPDVGGARPAAPPRLAPARGRRRPATQPSRASRGRSSPRTPGLRPLWPAPSSQDPDEDAPRSPLPPRAVSLARARTPERDSQGPSLLLRPAASSEPAIPFRALPVHDPRSAQPSGRPGACDRPRWRRGRGSGVARGHRLLPEPVASRAPGLRFL